MEQFRTVIKSFGVSSGGESVSSVVLDNGMISCEDLRKTEWMFPLSVNAVRARSKHQADTYGNMLTIKHKCAPPMPIRGCTAKFLLQFGILITVICQKRLIF